MAQHHPTWTQSYIERALLPETSPLTAYLLRLIAIKRTNLCLSADVTSTAALLSLAEEVGDSICLLKTHADIINDFSDRTVKQLRDIAKRKKFLVFEDRKFGDIGETVQKQYTGGPLAIARWAEITNAHIFPGPAIVSSLKDAASTAIATFNQSVQTEISAEPSDSSSPAHHADQSHLEVDEHGNPADDRKQSVVSISTTISQSISPQPTPIIEDEGHHDDAHEILERLGSTPFLRALLLLAEMSSAGNLMTGAYTEQCVKIARQQKDFVMGFIAQRSLNTEPGDNFLTMTPGVKIPPKGQEGKMGDGKGQQYTSPRQIVYEQGSDVIIVGRGIIEADNRAEEAERYRKEAWAAYEERTAKK
ncbi:orotidine 5'-phosphate decarboxylase [Diplodia seriata]|uniref:Orotidine 5'-phosphate decarboxylase n=1 Tax=Diplodia seriata TaxID=420778 RepID=A0A0G2EBS1_9PEZI|nr:putative orotidine-5phosphate decarboxylase [Diplodia seriata]OMP82943.1 Orotidine 5'-phosphate decarboxylase [Diplodia seriata]